MFQELDRYDKIGLDFDETLIGNKMSQQLVDYVLNNPQKEYHIITFRTKSWVDEIPHILLKHYGIDFFKQDIIKSIQSIPENLYYQYLTAKNLYERNHPYFKEYYEWKADICKEMKIGVLVDDNINIKEYLDKNGIFFINI